MRNEFYGSPAVVTPFDKVFVAHVGAMSLIRFLALVTALIPATALAGSDHVATHWQAAQSSEVRLIAPLPASKARDGWHYGSIEFRLPADAKTYWRTAGETGVPPSFAFDGSQGIINPEVLFPAPVAFDDGVGGLAYGYIAGATFPVRFKLADGASYRLDIKADYGVCLKNMCVPAQTKVSIAPGGAGDPGLTDRVEAALKLVPAKIALNQGDPLAVTAVKAEPAKDGLALIVSVRGEQNASQRIFVEGEDVFTPVGNESKDGITRHRFMIQRAGDSKPRGNIRITIADANRATETTVNLDSILKP